jgi:AcrR family transcriptional regulator
MRQPKTDAILDAAERLFTRFGLDKTAMDDVAREARAAKATLYAHFKSKEALFLRVLEREVDRWFVDVSKAADWEMPAPALLERLSIAAIGYLEDKPLLQDLYTGKYLELIGGWRERLPDLRERTVAVIRSVLELGVRQGHLRADLDVESAAGFLDDLLLAHFVFHRPRMSMQKQKRRLRWIVDFAVRGMQPPKKAGARRRS